MKVNDGYENANEKKSYEATDASENFLSNSNIIAIYTILSILLKMRDQLGLEAMLEYVQNYLRILETHNPRFKMAVSKAITLINVEKVYKDGVINGESEHKA